MFLIVPWSICIMAVLRLCQIRPASQCWCLRNVFFSVWGFLGFGERGFLWKPGRFGIILWDSRFHLNLCLAAFPGTALPRWVGALLLTVEVEAQVSPGALRTPEGWLLSSLLGSGVGGSLSPRLVSTGARGGATPQWGGKTPPCQLLCRHWQGPCGLRRRAPGPCGLCGAWREWSSSVCSCSGAPLLTLSLERGGFAGAWPVPGLLVTQLQVWEHEPGRPRGPSTCLLALAVCFPCSQPPTCAFQGPAVLQGRAWPVCLTIFPMGAVSPGDSPPFPGRPAPGAAPSSDFLPKCHFCLLPGQLSGLG